MWARVNIGTHPTAEVPIVSIPAALSVTELCMTMDWLSVTLLTSDERRRSLASFAEADISTR
jgi:hypothetical protein